MFFASLQSVKKNRDPRWDEEFQFMLEEAPTNDRVHVEVVSTSKRMGLLHPKVNRISMSYMYLTLSFIFKDLIMTINIALWFLKWCRFVFPSALKSSIDFSHNFEWPYINFLHRSILNSMMIEAIIKYLIYIIFLVLGIFGLCGYIPCGCH